MTNWKSTLDISNMWALAKNDRITVSDLSLSIALKLDRLAPTYLTAIAFATIFRRVAKATAKMNKEDAQAKFNRQFENLYNWADENRIWIKTF